MKDERKTMPVDQKKKKKKRKHEKNLCVNLEQKKMIKEKVKCIQISRSTKHYQREENREKILEIKERKKERKRGKDEKCMKIETEWTKLM